MKRCKHVVSTYRWWCGDLEWETLPQRRPPDASVCNLCGAWLALGESNDAPAEVQVEMRAAELVANALVRYRNSHGWRSSEMTDDEMDGLFWGDEEPSASHLAGYLARCIATHPDGGE